MEHIPSSGAAWGAVDGAATISAYVRQPAIMRCVALRSPHPQVCEYISIYYIDMCLDSTNRWRNPHWHWSNAPHSVCRRRAERGQRQWGMFCPHPWIGRQVASFSVRFPESIVQLSKYKWMGGKQCMSMHLFSIHQTRTKDFLKSKRLIFRLKIYTK